MRLIDLYHPQTIGPGTVFLYGLLLKRMEEPQVNISATMPSMDDHVAFIERHPYRAWYLIEWDNAQLVGNVSASHRNEIGIVLLREYRHMGIGTEAVLALCRMLEPLPAIPSERRGCWIANVNPDNAPSRKMFEAMGGKLIQATYELPGLSPPA